VAREVVRFRRSPGKRWADRVLRLYSAAERRVAAENAALRQAGPHGSEDERLRERALERYLAGISVAELESYPGIGPATIAKLRAAGFEHLAELRGRPIEVEGLGPKRLGDVRKAVGDLIKQAHSRFAAGACPEARQLTEQL